jgi:hypothetical protein
VTIRLACVSTFTVLGLTCSSMTSARSAALMPAPALHAPPVSPLPMITTIVVPAPTNYMDRSAAPVTYAQPLAAIPRGSLGAAVADIIGVRTTNVTVGSA